MRGIAVQYWFYYWFNQFNDLHESDWEMIQVAFDAATAQEALERGPSQLAYAQHEGGERRDWNDPRVEKEGTHPVVYVSSGSHASQYWSALFLGNGRSGSGLGCDDTRGPSPPLEPTPILVSTFPALDSRDAWLTYRGHWGQHEPGVSNGPTGPNTKRQWLEPFRWMGGLRTSSPTVPHERGAGRSGDRRLLRRGRARVEPPQRHLLEPAHAAPRLRHVRRSPSRSRPFAPAGGRSSATPLRARRAGGQIVDCAARVYWEHRRVLVPIGLVAVPLGALAVGGAGARSSTPPGCAVPSTRSRTTRPRASSPCSSAPSPTGSRRSSWARASRSSSGRSTGAATSACDSCCAASSGA